jgi:hypothetical protein
MSEPVKFFQTPNGHVWELHGYHIVDAGWPVDFAGEPDDEYYDDDWDDGCRVYTNQVWEFSPEWLEWWEEHGGNWVTR